MTTQAAMFTLSLHDALPISGAAAACDVATNCTTANHSPCASASRRNDSPGRQLRCGARTGTAREPHIEAACQANRSEEHTSELQSQSNLVCRLPLEKKKTNT